ncbi:hypothetical protein pb186bvf_019883 [Paramecium bursaria]
MSDIYIIIIIQQISLNLFVQQECMIVGMQECMYLGMQEYTFSHIFFINLINFLSNLSQNLTVVLNKLRY